PGRVLLTLTRNPNRDGGRDHTAHRLHSPTAASEANAPVDPRQGGRRLTALMNTRGLAIGDLAADLGVSRSAVAHWRQGQRIPVGDLAERVARRLGVDPDRLWPDRDHSRDGIAR
ncbi:MAG: helix-turn-helix domain-containing protein, partial [Micromonosporaceae bacterium]|nr:helix-turn-helix domain-containing protein [Micromonosporaceae bacterium]